MTRPHEEGSEEMPEKIASAMKDLYSSVSFGGSGGGGGGGGGGGVCTAVDPNGIAGGRPLGGALMGPKGGSPTKPSTGPGGLRF